MSSLIHRKNYQVGKWLIGGVLALSCTHAAAYPIDPAKRPVNIDQGSDLDKSFVLAYDSEDRDVVYYAPKAGRVATMNGMPLLGFAMFGNGEGVLMAQFDFGVFGDERKQLFSAIKRAGKTPVPLPFKRTKVKPLIPGFDPETGEEEVQCVEVEDEATGEIETQCDTRMFKELKYSKNGPSLGENIAITAVLNPVGAMIYRTFLKGGNSLQINLEAEYYSAGTAFKAWVTVDYDKLFENFHAYAAYHDGYCTDIEMETFWEKEGLCLDRDASECGVSIRFVDDQNREITTPTIDPDDKEQQEKVLQAIDRLKKELEDEMLAAIGSKIGMADTKKPAYGFKLSAKYEKRKKGKRATFEFYSPRGVNWASTTIPAGIACVNVSQNGDVMRHTGGDCKSYWEGSKSFAEILAKEVNN